jgi:hypothetical protein
MRKKQPVADPHTREEVMEYATDSREHEDPSTGSTQRSPLSKRGMRAYPALVIATREVFERDGYIAARIRDLSRAAEISAGSFYTYFDSKEEVLAAVANAVQENMPHLRTTGVDSRREGSKRVWWARGPDVVCRGPVDDPALFLGQRVRTESPICNGNTHSIIPFAVRNARAQRV